MVRRVATVVLLTVALLLAGVQAAQADDLQQRGRRCRTEFGYQYCSYLLVNYSRHTVRAFGELRNGTQSCCAWIQSAVLLRGGNASEPTEHAGDIPGPGSRVFAWSELHPCEASPQGYRARISVNIGGIGRILDSNLAETTCRR
jgi:hypothetical protein